MHDPPPCRISFPEGRDGYGAGQAILPGGVPGGDRAPAPGESYRCVGCDGGPRRRSVPGCAVRGAGRDFAGRAVPGKSGFGAAAEALQPGCGGVGAAGAGGSPVFVPVSGAGLDGDTLSGRAAGRLLLAGASGKRRDRLVAEGGRTALSGPAAGGGQAVSSGDAFLPGEAGDGGGMPVRRICFPGR